MQGLCAGQHFTKGSVVNEEGTPLTGVTVRANRSSVVTGKKGDFLLKIDSFPQSVSFSFPGFVTSQVIVASEESQTVTLVRNFIDLPAATVTAFESNVNIHNAPVAVSLLTKDQLLRYSNASLVNAGDE